jgi:Putative auto-transporter adhesin, head GIN domain
MLQHFRVAALFTFFLIIANRSTYAGEKGINDPLLRRTLILNQPCLQIEVWGNVEIILSPAHSDRIVIQGTVKDVNGIDTKLKKGKLSVNAGKLQDNSTTTIILPAALLNFIRVNGNGGISSAGNLNRPHLKVELNGEVKVQIQSLGKISVVTPEEYNLVRN